jgi:hypothetical protein
MVSPPQGTAGVEMNMADHALAADHRKSSTAAQTSRSFHFRPCWAHRPPQENHRGWPRHQPQRHKRLPVNLPQLHNLLKNTDHTLNHQTRNRKLSQLHIPSHLYQRSSQLTIPCHTGQFRPPKAALLPSVSKITRPWTGYPLFLK